MSCFSTVSAVTANSELDLTKHVNYTSGMILGVDDFTQEFAYLAGRDRWLARDALGYGTISGLSVKIEEDKDKGFRVMVQPGVAVSPRGQFICVAAAQCAYLNQWLAAADSKDLKKWIRPGIVSPPITSPPITSPPTDHELTLYVTLCYRDCLTDNVPIPGEPCRSEEELTAASRVTDDFSLELRFEKPPQAEEDAVRKYVGWLRQITISDSAASTPIDDFIKAIRDEWLTPASPPITSPPPVLQIQTDDFCEYMRTAFRLWVTELRNVLSERKTGCAVEMTGGNSIEDCVLLAELQIPLVSISSGWKVSDTRKIEKNEEKRPFLLHLRMLQEWMLCGTGQTSANPPVTSPNVPTVHNHLLKDLSDVSAASPAVGDTLIFEGGKWNSKPPVIGGEGVTAHAALTGLENDDHQQYLLVDCTRALGGDLIGGGHQLTNLAAATADGQAVIFEQAIKNGDEAGGDLSGNYPNPTISKLQGITVDATPSEGQILKFKGEKWIADDPETTTGGITEHGALAGLDADDHQHYLLASGDRALTGKLDGGGNLIINLAKAEADGQAVIFEQAIKTGDPAGGDLTGTYPNPTINLLQGDPVQISSTKNPGDALVWNGTAWTPQAQTQIPPSTQKPQLILPLATITRISERPIYEIWFNIDAPGNLVKVVDFKDSHLRILDETDLPTTFTAKVNFRLSPGVRNVFIASLILEANQPDPDRMRFSFDVSSMNVEITSNTTVEQTSLLRYIDKNNIKFPGFLDGRLATIFVRGAGKLG